MRSWIRWLLWTWALGALLTLHPDGARAASATFDNDLEGWEAVGFDIDFAIFPPSFNVALVDNVGDMVHEAANGNPGGYARLTDAIEEPASFAAAPASFLNGGDLTSLMGSTFSFDHRLFDPGVPNVGIAPYSVFFISGNVNDLNALVWTAPPPGGATDWVHFEFTLDPADLSLFQDTPISVVDPSLPNITPASAGFRGTMNFDQILANVDEILVAFELVDNIGTQNQEHGGVDNIQLPEPTSLALLVLLGTTFAIRRRSGSPV